MLRTHVPVLGLSVLYLFAVLPIAVFWGLALAVPVSVASMLAFNFFFLPPTYSFTLQDSSNWFALGVFLVTAVVVSDLAARSRRRATESTLLAEISASLLERGELNGELDRLAADAARALQVESARIVVGTDGPSAGGAEPHPLLAGGRRVGTIYLENPRQGSVAARRRLLPALASLLGVAIDRTRLAQEALEAEAVDARVETGRTPTHALPRLWEVERFDRIVAPAPAGRGSHGFTPKELQWILVHAPSETLILRPDPTLAWGARLARELEAVA